MFKISPPPKIILLFGLSIDFTGFLDSFKIEKLFEKLYFKLEIYLLYERK